MPNFSQFEIFLKKYFSEAISPSQLEQFRLAYGAYLEWNEKINVISRKDIENLAERHFLHSLAIAKRLRFLPGTRILDAGTGGGFPGIPLAILFPEAKFHLVDSRQKKITVVRNIVQAARLDNVQYSVQRIEQLTEQYDFVVSRAVAAMEKFLPWVKKRIHCRSRHPVRNGILYLRGGEIEAEMNALGKQAGQWSLTPLYAWFDEEFFDSKYLLEVSFC
ncbi:MAG: 16S rRNA (guanine(527)-N(7))-methyltransferase RsmG [Bacteroidota bacterium]